MTEKIYGNRWKVIDNKPLGKGGQGIAYLVENINDENKKQYVLKRLRDDNRISRFKVEIETIKQLDHPNIVKFVDADLEGDKHYLVTEYYKGGELSYEKINKLSTIEKLSLFLEICQAIGHAHENGIIHRDIKPANILLKEDGITPVVTDFGICFNTEEGFERLTQTIEQVGARFYMAPELADGRAEEVTPSADVYSLGKLLYWLFKGRIYDREDFIYEDDKDLRNIFRNEHAFHFIYERIFEKTIKKNPSDRFQDANELATKINDLISIIKNKGRFLDANVISPCLFCGVGKYSKKEIVPTIKKVETTYGQPTNYLLNYSGLALLSNSIPNWEVTYPQGNIDTDVYLRFLILTCDYCGNIQTFNTQNTSWENAKPKIN